ncbi:hypothetical protein EV702DRAFT_1049390 [Suillus placidus]|uniref:Uncharacterized protein n=1 Tax=Suillus placidus TaxID=48579 RepID=A0A9P6ZKU3_9AGAM|nr:hypothetical protein EV702DRAFT_1049390 [Suillus placidus]
MSSQPAATLSAAIQAATIEAGAKRVAAIELEIEAKQMKILMRKAKGIRPSPTPYKGKKAVKGAGGSGDLDDKPKLAPSNKVESWVSGVQVNKSIKSQDASSSRTTYSVLLADILKGPLEAHVPGGALVGGFSDGEDEGNELEHLATHGITAKEGRSAAADCILKTTTPALPLKVFRTFLYSEVQTLLDFTYNPQKLRASTQLSPKGPSKAATVSILKRKASEDLKLVFGSKIEGFSDDAYESALFIHTHTLKSTPLLTVDNTIDIDAEVHKKHEIKFEKPKPKFEKTKMKLEKPTHKRSAKILLSEMMSVLTGDVVSQYCKSTAEDFWRDFSIDGCKMTFTTIVTQLHRQCIVNKDDIVGHAHKEFEDTFDSKFTY